MRKVLIETRMNSLRLNESKAPKKGCLGRLEGVCADFKNPTRNGRLYPLDLWKKVFDDSLFKESLDNKTLFGELDHPEDRFEPLISEACVVMTDYTIDEDKGLIYGGFDILDTPKGRILKSIVDYGSVVGVSSRGQGDIIESADGERVDENSYEFACFDVVSTPAVEKARQNVMESIKRVKDISFKESIDKQIADAETLSDLNIIRSVVRSSNISESEMDTIIESIEDRCKTLQEADKTIVVSEEDSKETLNESAKTIRDNRQLYNCIKSLRSKVSAYKHRESRYIDTINESKEREQELQKQLREARKRVVESNRTQKQTGRVLTERIKTKSSELIDSKRTISELQEQNRQLNKSLSEALRSSKMKEREDSTRTSMLQEKLDKSLDRIKYLEGLVDKAQDEHSKEITSLDKEVSDYSTLLSEAQQRLESKTSTIKELTESVSNLKSDLETQKSTNNFLKEQLGKYQKQYVESLSTLNDVDAETVMKNVSLKTSPENIKTLVERVRDKMDRYSKFPISQNSITDSENVTLEKFSHSKEDAEDIRLSNFILNATKSM